MKICFIVGAFPNMKCGIGDYTSILANEVSRLGNEVSVITSSKCNISKNQEIKIFNCIDNWDFSSTKTIIKILNEINPDIVHIQYPNEEYGKSFFINFLPLIIKRKIRCKIIQTVHEYTNYTFKGKLKNLINYKFSDELIVVEDQYEEMIKSFLPIISNQIKISNIPISSNIPKSNMSEDEIKIIKQKIGWENNKIISYFGFINELKGVEILINSFDLIIKRDENVRLLLLSELNSDNTYHKEIIDLINEKNLKDKIKILGFIESSEDVANYLRATQVSILPFKDGVSERNGSFLAAYNQGIPVITTSTRKKDLDGIYYIEPNNIELLVEKYFELEKNIANYDRNTISWDIIAKKHINLYRRNNL